MTDPTADAIAALEVTEAVLSHAWAAGVKAGEPPIWLLLADKPEMTLRLRREFFPAAVQAALRSALLSAQGQAGKPVADSSAEIAALKAERRQRIANAVDMQVNSFAWMHAYDTLHGWLTEQPDILRRLLKDGPAIVLPSPAQVPALQAHITTARTALEAAERNVRLLRNRLAPGLDETSANLILDDLNDALRATSPTEKDDGHGRG